MSVKCPKCITGDIVHYRKEVVLQSYEVEDLDAPVGNFLDTNELLDVLDEWYYCPACHVKFGYENNKLVYVS